MKLLDNEGYLERSGFFLRAKQPAIDWILKEMQKGHSALIFLPPQNLSLERINLSPVVFLVQPDIELLQEVEAQQQWQAIHLMAFREFLLDFTEDQTLWPELTEGTFHDWFEMIHIAGVKDLSI